MNPNKALWEKGDFTRIADSMRESGEELVQKLSVTKGMKVLDLGCGDGTTALPEARLGADVLGVDIAANLSRPAMAARKKQGLQTASFRKATPQTCAISRTAPSISSSAFSGPCSRRSRSTSPRK
jgi:cyclopropane fatty-acyl-phospholipid synthase-like methyltransferase